MDWNPQKQEVIVIDDSPSPQPVAYTDFPAYNTRSAMAYGRQRPDIALYQQTRNFADLLPLPASFPQSHVHAPSAAYGSPYTRQAGTMAYQPGYCHPATSFGANYPQTMVAGLGHRTQIDHRQNPAATSYRLACPQQSHLPLTGQQLVGRQKRKREEYDAYSDRTTLSRHATYTALSSGSSRHIRIQHKNREVRLRKEVDPTHTAGNSSSSSPSSSLWDDKHGHYIIEPDSSLTSRYRVHSLLGQGTFGKVIRAFDHHRRTWVAIKIIRAIPKYRDASMIELRVLRTLQENDPDNDNNCIHLQDCFDFRNHVCIVTELLDQSIFDFLKDNNFAPFPYHHIQHFAQQLFSSVAFLHKLELIHTDLKPENILLVNRNSRAQPYVGVTGQETRKVLINSALRLIDFGSATFQDEYHSSVVSTRHYRAPEIILGMGWSFPCDIWSIGCILVEFFTGNALFQTHDNLEHLMMMEVVFGRIEGRLIRSCSKAAQKMFRPSGRLDYPNRETTKDSKKFVKQMKSLAELFPRTNVFNIEFLDLLSRIFIYDPKDRITAAQALRHPFLLCVFAK